MGDCGVCIYGGDGEPFQFFDSKIVAARKPHTCVECGSKIEVGQKYEYVKAKYDDVFDSYHTCLVCAEIATAFSCEGRQFGGGLWDEMEYLYDDMTTGCLDKLKTAEAKKFLVKRWSDWQLMHR